MEKLSYSQTGVFHGRKLPVIFSSLSPEYLGCLYREFPNADASSFAGRARNSCEFAEKDTGEKCVLLGRTFTCAPPVRIVTKSLADVPF